MNNQKTMLALAAVTIAGIAGCSSGDPADETGTEGAPTTAAPLQTTTQPGYDHSRGMDTTPLPEPTPLPGDGQEAVELAVEKFTIHWACYRAFAQQPQREWFDSWSNLASDEFVQQQRVAFNDTWAWAWNTETQVIGCQRRGDMQVVEVDDSEAIARITIERHLYHADARASEGEIETKTYDVAVETDADRIPLVVGAAETASDAAFPPPLNTLSR